MAPLSFYPPFPDEAPTPGEPRLKNDAVEQPSMLIRNENIPVMLTNIMSFKELIV